MLLLKASKDRNSQNGRKEKVDAQNFPECTDWGKARVYDWASQDGEKSPWLVIVLWQRWRWGNASVNGEGHFRSEPRSTNAHQQHLLVRRTLPPHHQNISLINGCHKNHATLSTHLTSLQSWTCPHYCKQLFWTTFPQLTQIMQYDMPFHVYFLISLYSVKPADHSFLHVFINVAVQVKWHTRGKVWRSLVSGWELVLLTDDLQIMKPASKIKIANFMFHFGYKLTRDSIWTKEIHSRVKC